MLKRLIRYVEKHIIAGKDNIRVITLNCVKKISPLLPYINQ